MNHENSGSVSRRTVIAGTATAAAALTVPIAAGSAQAATGSEAAHGPVTAVSPCGRVRVTLRLDSGTASYSVAVDGTEVVPASPLGLTLEDADFAARLTLTGRGRPRTVAVDYELLQGKVSRVRKTATERVVSLRNAKGLPMDVVLRADSEGAAFRYRFPDRGDGVTRTVVAEATGLTLHVPADGGAQFTQPYTVQKPKYQEWYIPRDHHTVPALGDATTSVRGASFPLLARTAARDGKQWWVLASESGMDGTYAACHLAQPALDTAARKVTYTVAFPYDDEALGTLGPGTPQITGAWQTPWRFVAVGRTAAEVANTTLATDLGVPCAIEDTSWVRPGPATFSWMMDHSSPQSLEATVKWFDLGKAMGWPYALVDAKWDQMNDAAGNAVPLERIVSEAAARGLKVFLWHNSGGTNNNSASTPRDLMADATTRRARFKLLRDAGVAGVKVDMWEADKQQLLARQREVIEDAARYRLHIVLHNTTVPRGWDRTYPHLLGVEAGLASENYSNTKPLADQMPEQTTIAAISRNVVGAFDYGTTLLAPYALPQSPRRTTDAHELALTVIYQSGFNGYADGPEAYLAQPAEVRELLGTVPVAWDETRFLAADPASHVVVARRKGRTWYIAGVNGRTLTIAPGLDSGAADYTAPTGQAQKLAFDLRDLGVKSPATLRLFTDTSATDRTLRTTTRRGSRFTIDTAAFGGFIAVL
ncbi:glycoside hydrolase family 97 protein [Streptomyces sp. SID13726]|uniref:glycoside hydrolase family 97 protein n=1 Tax=Streptomyces sp. SID13726 TaxID=2706058 RepID=UPI0013BDB156|nr:glycoside hydrolase family 97 protein [Streptomyces sp. SID13726]NEB05747.1 glycoside hydrolase family 97 protein [Streptomyces sp. SID13726]